MYFFMSLSLAKTSLDLDMETKAKLAECPIFMSENGFPPSVVNLASRQMSL